MTEILYKKDSKGKVLQWSAEVNQSIQGVQIILKAGELEGKIVETIRNNIKGKNIGKSNETSPLTQATLEVESLYRRKKDLGYKSLEDIGYNNYLKKNEDFGLSSTTNTISMGEYLKQHLSIDNTDALGNLKPMKAQQYYRSKKDWIDPNGKLWDDRKYFYLLNPYALKEKGAIIIKFPCLIQPKINGVRCTISFINNKVQILSKEGKRYSLPHLEVVLVGNKTLIEENFKGYGLELDDIFFDGELYIHGEKLQTISSAVKAPNLDTNRVQFIAFDLGVKNLNNISRFTILKDIINQIKEKDFTNSIDIVTTYKVKSDAIVQTLTDNYIKDGYEGSILRNPEGFYQFGKRPMDMVKLKRVIDEEFKIIDIIPQDKNPDLGLFVCITKQGKEFQVNPKGDTHFKSLVLFQKHLFINKMLTCTFYEYTEDMIPFHVIDNIVRDYE